MAAWNEKEVEALINVFSEETIQFSIEKAQCPKNKKAVYNEVKLKLENQNQNNITDFNFLFRWSFSCKLLPLLGSFNFTLRQKMKESIVRHHFVLHALRMLGNSIPALPVTVLSYYKLVRSPKSGV